VDRHRNIFVLIWLCAVPIGTTIFGHGFVWPCIFVAIAYCAIAALLERSQRPVSGRADPPENASRHDAQENQADEPW